MTSAVSFDQVVHRYGSQEALKGVSFDIPKGAILGLVGPNGSGKSTTLNIITTLLSATSGEVHVSGWNVKTDPFEVKKRIGYAPEEITLYNGLSAREFVALSGSLHHMDPKRIDAATEAMLQNFQLETRADELLGSFSKGMRRKALLASALVHEPELLILDEPLEGLDIVAQRILKDLIRDHAAKGFTIIYSTHILEVLEGFCSHLILLKKGELIGFGSLQSVREQIGQADIGSVFFN